MSENNDKGVNKNVINWYPGHMVKAQNEIKDSLKLIDIVVEVLDARVPISSRNPLIDTLAKDKARIIILNKSDLADKEITKKWMDYFTKKGMLTLIVNTAESSHIKKIVEAIQKKGKEVYDIKYANKKIDMKPIYRVLVVGIPNVGKSTIINKIANKQVVQVGNRPGITVKKQWIRVGNNIELLDTPGLLWPKLEGENVGINLALTGNIKQEILDVEELALEGIKQLKKVPKYQVMLQEKYKLKQEDMTLEAYEILEEMGRKRGCLVSGGVVAIEKISKLFLDELKNGKLGAISLDKLIEEEK